MSDEFATATVLVLMLVGLIGTLIPILPGILLMWIAAVFYGFAVGFDAFSVGVLVVITILATVSVAVGIALPKRAATASGASTSSQLAAGVGAVIGFFAIPVVGVVVGALAGIALAEWRDKGEWSAARLSTIAVAKGFGLSALVQFGMGFLILVVWLVWAQAVIW
jgi:uncharacterized protein YqgC (DUF456 family)